MSEIILKFPLLNGGRAGGINGADLETFAKDPSYYVARECAQNTLDAVAEDGGTAELHFDLIQMEIDKLPCLHNLETVFQSCKEYRPNDEDVCNYCNKGIESLLKDKIPVLCISDYKTTGLTGSDTDVDGRWYGLIKSEGSSNKDENAGGSFGIGKAAPIAASLLRTVYYSTKVENGVAFQGVSVQPTHRDENGWGTQSVGYIGYYNSLPSEDENYFPSIRDETVIPDLFIRKQIGTSIYVPGYIDSENWLENIIKSLLNDFWLAILHGKISFRVGSESLNKLTLEKYIDSFKDTNGFTAERYYKTYTKGTCFPEKLSHIGGVELYLREEQDLSDKSVAYLRKNLMLIYEEKNFRFRKNFTGLFICDNEDGNKILRAMEPPKHDEWQPKRLANRYPALNGSRILENIRKLINAKIKELMPLISTTEFELNDIRKYLPYSADDSDGNMGGDQKEDERETFKKIAASSDVVSIPVTKTSDMKKDENGDEKVPGGERTGTSNPRPGPNPPPKPSPPGPISEVMTSGIVANIKSRVLSYSNKEKCYYVALTSQNIDFKGKVYLQSVGDDNEVEDVNLIDVVDENGKIQINSDGSVPVALVQGKTQKMKIFIENNEELSLRFIHGN